MSKYVREKHRETIRRYREKRKSQGICINCGNKRDRLGLICSDCSTKNKGRHFAKREERRKAGLCLHCGKRPPLSTGANCEICWFKHRSHYHTGSVKHWVVLRQLLESQDYRCAYTGLKLEIGCNASVDHKISKYNGGTNDISNLHWVDTGINTRWKGKLSHSEFLCKLTIMARWILNKKPESTGEVPEEYRRAR